MSVLKELKYFNTPQKKCDFLLGIFYGGYNFYIESDPIKYIINILSCEVSYHLNDMKYIAYLIQKIYSPTFICQKLTKKNNKYFTILDALKEWESPRVDFLVKELKKLKFKYAYEINDDILINNFFNKNGDPLK